VRRQPPARRPLHRDHQARACAALPGALSLLGACMRQPSVEGHGPGACRVWGVSLAPATTPLRTDSKHCPGPTQLMTQARRACMQRAAERPLCLRPHGAAAPARGGRVGLVSGGPGERRAGAPSRRAAGAHQVRGAAAGSRTCARPRSTRSSWPRASGRATWCARRWPRSATRAPTSWPPRATSSASCTPGASRVRPGKHEHRMKWYMM